MKRLVIASTEDLRTQYINEVTGEFTNSSGIRYKVIERDDEFLFQASRIAPYDMTEYHYGLMKMIPIHGEEDDEWEETWYGYLNGRKVAVYTGSDTSPNGTILEWLYRLDQKAGLKPRIDRT